MRYDKTLKEEALKLSDEAGVKFASNHLGIPYDTLVGWRSKRRNIKCCNGYKHVSTHNEEHNQHPENISYVKKLEKENMELRRTNKILQDTLEIFTQYQKNKVLY